MKELTAFQRDTLRLIAGMEETPIGLDIKRALEDYYGDNVNHGRLYPNLDTLVELGFINKETVDGRTNSYELSEQGEKLLRARDEFNAENTASGTPKNLKREA